MIQHTRLENGLTLILEPVPSSELISIECFVPCGALTEPVLGCSSVLEEWARRGTANRSAEATEDAWDDLGAVRGSEVGLEGTEWGVTCLAADGMAALELLHDWILQPNLTQGFETSLELAKAALLGLEDSPDELLNARLWKQALSSSHGRSPYGTLEGLEALNADLVRADYKQRCTPQGAILSVSGAISWEMLLEQVRRLFGAWRGQTFNPLEVRWNPPSQRFEARDTAQSQIGMLMPLMPFATAGYYESRFALEILGGGNFNRLFQELREDHGLVYGVHAGSSFMQGAGTLEVFASCTPNHAEETVERIHQQLEQWKKGVSAEELSRARVGINTSLAMSLESVGARAAINLRDQHLLGFVREPKQIQAQLDAVSIEQVNAWLSSLDFTALHTFVLGAEIV